MELPATDASVLNSGLDSSFADLFSEAEKHFYRSHKSQQPANVFKGCTGFRGENMFLSLQSGFSLNPAVFFLVTLQVSATLVCRI